MYYIMMGVFVCTVNKNILHIFNYAKSYPFTMNCLHEWLCMVLVIFNMSIIIMLFMHHYQTCQVNGLS